VHEIKRESEVLVQKAELSIDYGVCALQATSRISESPPPAGGSFTYSAFEKRLLFGRECPWVQLPHNCLVSRVEAAPHKSEIARVIIEKPLIRESRVKRIVLFEVVVMPAGRAIDGHHLKIIARFGASAPWARSSERNCQNPVPSLTPVCSFCDVDGASERLPRSESLPVRVPPSAA
jgi:hypothetical protein